MQYRIIRGTKQIGGTITEIVSDLGEKLWIDFGMELSVKDPYTTDEVVIKEMQENPPDAVLFTHIHGDHIGLLHAIPCGVNIYLGQIAMKMLINIRETLLMFDDFEQDDRDKLQKEIDILRDSSRIVIYRDGITMDVCGIKVTPFEVDHSVQDAYMLRFEENGKYILHTGDFRTHGRKGYGF